MFGVHRIALCRCVASPMLNNNGLLVRPPLKMEIALGNMKTPSEIFFSNTILRTYINFSDPPLRIPISSLKYSSVLLKNILNLLSFSSSDFCCRKSTIIPSSPVMRENSSLRSISASLKS